MLEKALSVLGTLVLLTIAYLLSNNKKAINYRIVIWGTVLQVIFALLILKSPPGKAVFSFLNDAIVRVLSFTDEGAMFLFGTDFRQHFFAFSVLPTIIFFSSLMSVMYYLGIMQKIVEFFAVIMRKTMRTSGAETLSCSANIFVGQTEAPLVIRPYVSEMTMSELLAVMTGGMATVAGGVMAAYVGMLHQQFPNIAGHLLAASIMSAPAALVMAKLILPETEKSKTAGHVQVEMPKTQANVIDAAATGAADGLSLALNVAAMLLAFIALLAMLNFCIGGVGRGINYLFHTNVNLTMQAIFGFVFAPLAWIMGVPRQDCMVIGQLMGTKTVLNEFVAYADLANMLNSGVVHLHERSIIIATYALCGFSNFSSIAIQIGGIGGIAPNRRQDLARLGIRALIAGTLACFMTATIAGIIV